MSRVQRVTIETVSACNLRCVHCAVSLDDYVGEVLELEDFRKVLPLLKRWRPVVFLSGHGETLMHKQFKEMFLEVVRAGCVVGFQTNGVLLDRDMIDFLLAHSGRKGHRLITVSLDAAEKELFEKIRRRADWDVVMENLRYLRDRKEALGKYFPLLQVEFVAMLQNIHQLPDLVDLSRDLGADYLVVSDLTEYPLVAGQNLRNDLESALPHLREAMARAYRIGFPLEALPGIEELLHPPRSEGEKSRERGPLGSCRVKLCTDPWEFMFLKANGSLLPCCWIQRPAIDAATDLFEGWNGESYRELRRRVASTAPPEECVTCFARPWTHVPRVAAGRPGLVYALFRGYRFMEHLRRRFRVLMNQTGDFASPRRIARMLKAVIKG